MRFTLITLAMALLLAGLACNSNGPVPGNNPPVTPPGGNPGGQYHALTVYIDFSRTMGNAPLPVNMNAVVSGGKSPYYYRWDVNGDGYWDYGGPGIYEVAVHYASFGLFDVLLEVEDGQGQFYQATGLIDVKPSGPTAIAKANVVVGNHPLNVSFRGNESVDVDGEIVLYEWDFESDGIWDYDSETQPNTNHTYSQIGTYNATLRVTDDDDFTATASIQIIAL